MEVKGREGKLTKEKRREEKGGGRAKKSEGKGSGNEYKRDGKG